MSGVNKPLCEIRNFTEFLERNLNRKVLEYTLKSLTKPGDHFGAIVQAVNVKVVNKIDSDAIEDLHLVVKTPIQNEYLAAIFMPELSFVKEVRFYSDIIPAIELIQQTANVPEDERLDVFIQCLGSRISLNPGAKYADLDAVLLLENVKHQNYLNRDKIIGFDAEETLAILKAIAKFHALCIATRRLQPQKFDSIRPNLKKIISTNNQKRFEALYNDVNRIENLSTEIRISLGKDLEVGEQFYIKENHVVDTPYTTIVHKDLWTNNIMIKKDANSTDPTKIKIYDFQLYYYESFVHDLIFFLFSSVRNDEMKIHFHTFISHYHLEFMKMMKFVECPLDDYSYEKMWKEIQEKAKLSLFYVFYRIKLMRSDDSSVPSLSKPSENATSFEQPASKTVLDQWKFVIDIFMENGFI